MARLPRDLGALAVRWTAHGGVAEASAVLEEVVLAAAEAVGASADLVVAVLVAVELAVLGDAPMLLCFLLHSLNYTCISHA